MNLMLTLVIGFVFGLIGGMTMMVVAIKTGYFATRDELASFMESITTQNNEFASQMAQEFAKVDDRDDEFDSRIRTLEQTPTDISDLVKGWDEHKRWSLGCWNEVMRTKDSYLTQFQVRGILDRFLTEIGKIPTIDMPETKLNPIKNADIVQVYSGPMGPVGGCNVQGNSSAETLN